MKKILIICAGLCIGGVERFAANISIYAPKNEFSFDYLVFDEYPSDYVKEVESNGARVISIPSPKKEYIKYIKTLGELIDDNQYDVIHSHTQFNSGINLLIAKKHNVPIRIAHSHTSEHEHSIGLLKQTYENYMRKLIINNATNYCACGSDAGKWMYGNHSFTIINNGIDVSNYQYNEANRDDIRNKYNLPSDAFVIGHSGTLSKLKNQEFLIELLPRLLKRNSKVYLMLLGDGSDDIKKHLRDLTKEYELTDRVIFTGSVNNVNEYLSAFDVFAFPSLREGTPLALIEAQANGLPCIINDVIPNDACLTDLITKVSIYDVDYWLSTITNAKRKNSIKYAKIIEETGYDINNAMIPLYELYRK